MTCLDDKSLSEAMTRCYYIAGRRVAIVFLAYERLADFSDTMNATILAHHLPGVVTWLKAGKEFDTIEFKNGSYIRLLKADKQTISEYYPSGYDEIIYDTVAPPSELDQFLDSFKIRGG